MQFPKGGNKDRIGMRGGEKSGRLNDVHDCILT